MELLDQSLQDWEQETMVLNYFQTNFPQIQMKDCYMGLSDQRQMFLVQRQSQFVQKTDAVCPRGADELNNPVDLVLPKVKLEPNVGVETGAEANQKIDGEGSAPKPGVDTAPNKDGVVDDAPKGLEEAALNGELKAEVEVASKPEELKVVSFGANGFEEVVLEKGFAYVWLNALEADAPKGLDGAATLHDFCLCKRAWQRLIPTSQLAVKAGTPNVAGVVWDPKGELCAPKGDGVVPNGELTAKTGFYQDPEFALLINSFSGHATSNWSVPQKLAKALVLHLNAIARI